MSGRYLSISRVVALAPRGLYTYIDTIFSQEDPARSDYLRAVLRAIAEDTSRSPELRRRAYTVLEAAARLSSDGVDRSVFARAAFLEELARIVGRGEPVAASGEEGTAALPSAGPFSGIAPLPIVVWAPHLRSPFNVGSVIRSAAAFGVSALVLGLDCPDLAHPRLLRAAMGAERYLPIERGGEHESRAILGEETPIVALETGAEPIDRFHFPERGVLVIGHEELGLSEDQRITARRSGGVVSIPLDGVKRSLNVGVALGVALSWWSAALRRTTG